MGTIIPENQALKRAVKWISENLKIDPDANLIDLINEAIFKFDLTPKDSQFLFSFYSKNK